MAGSLLEAPEAMETCCVFGMFGDGHVGDAGFKEASLETSPRFGGRRCNFSGRALVF